MEGAETAPSGTRPQGPPSTPLPPHPGQRHPLADPRRRTLWRDIPAAYGAWQSAYGLFRCFERKGVW
ncbi:transposase [Spiractinospora alimapuensis]|uniref:transposase n=1 Tax=Spiractinospora alimapuensis TaxID=2820884 RepID=UPI001F2AEFCB|nr:transposase [Spiractinospora alimapuensis]